MDVSSDTLVRLSRVREIPGMFIEPMNGPLRIRRGVMFRASTKCQTSHSRGGIRRHTQLGKSLIDDSSHFKSAHASLIVDQQDQVITIFEFNERSFGVVLLEYQVEKARDQLLSTRLSDIEHSLHYQSSPHFISEISRVLNDWELTVSLCRPSPISILPSGICQSPDRPGT